MIIVSAALAADGTTETAGGAIDWGLVVKIVGAMVPAIGWIAGQFGIRMGRRAALKADLEIRDKIKDEDQKKIIDQRIQITVAKLYGPSWLGKIVTGPTVLIVVLGAIWSLGFAYWTDRILTNDEGVFEWSWWALLTGYATILPLGLLPNLSERRGQNGGRNEDEAGGRTNPAPAELEKST